MKHYYSVLGREITKNQYFEQRENQYNTLIRLGVAKGYHWILSIMFENGEHYLTDTLLNDEQFERFVQKNKTAVIFAIHGF